MSEGNERDRRSAEGVRIIGPEEAQAALEAGAAAGRRPDDELRFGDVPPAPSGPRPPHRFPLPDSVDPAEAVPRPPIVPPAGVDPTLHGRPRPVTADEAHDPRPWGARVEGHAGDGSDGTAVLPVAGHHDETVDLRLAPPEAPAAGAEDDDPIVGADPEPPAQGAYLPAHRLGQSPEPPSPEAPAADIQPTAAPAWPTTPDPAGPDLYNDEGITVSGGYEDMPHWTDPPTGEVPRVLAERAERSARSDGDEDLAAWEALGTRSTTWRDDSTGWRELDALDDLDGDDLRVGALDQTRTEHSDLYSFDEDFERLEDQRSGQHRAIPPEAQVDDWEDFEDLDEPAPRVTRVSTRQARPPRPARNGRGRPPRPPAGEGDSSTGELGSRLGVGVGLVVLLLIAYAVGPVALLLLATAVVTTAAAEVYGMLRPSGFRPATLLGLVATVGIMFAAYWRGSGALPLVVVMVFVVAMLWYLLGVVDARPLANVAVTLSAFVWVGVLGSYAALLLRSHHGRGLFVGAVLPAVAADIVAYFTGRRVGSHPLAQSISPAKTWEGALGGGVAAVVVAAIVGHSVSPWGGFSHGLVLGLALAVLAPIGDLFESMVKRDLSVKDSGSTLSGHGGVLDRFDAVLLCLPAAFYLASFWGYVK